MMPDLKVLIGGRNFNISCNPGEESAAQESASFLDTEAQLLQGQLGRLPEDKMLLLSGLLLGDKIRALRHEQLALEETLSATQAKLNEVKLQSDLKVKEDKSSVLIKLPNSPESLINDQEFVELQNISNILDGLIDKVHISDSKNSSDKDKKSFGDSSQDSFL
jgi:cell division protein ZapA